MNYWLVRTKWGGENKKTDFINNDEWINGSADKYLDIVNRVEAEDILLLAEDSTISHYGICSGNEKDGRHLTVDKWTLLNDPILYLAKGGYSKTIVKINDENLLNSIKHGVDATTISNDIKIKAISIENFTVFKNEYLEFSDGLNVVIGENGTGKSHLLKLLYFAIEFNNVNPSLEVRLKNDCKCPNTKILSSLVKDNLINIFKPVNLDNLISKGFSESCIDINLNSYSIKFKLGMPSRNSVQEEILPTDFCKKSSIFIPAKEMLSFYEGFVPLYETRETSFDSIYYNLASSLGLSPLKNMESYPTESMLLSRLEAILEGKILLEYGRFYLESTQGHKTEIALVAEGLRKIATIAQLIANGSLNKNSILFWDEPEANLNPKLIRKMAEVLVELSRAGMQVFIATHSLFLVKELEILRSKEDKFRYFGLGFNGQDIRVSQSEDFEYLDDIVILDEELEQDQRFLSKKES